MNAEQFLREASTRQLTDSQIAFLLEASGEDYSAALQLMRDTYGAEVEEAVRAPRPPDARPQVLSAAPSGRVEPPPRRRERELRDNPFVRAAMPAQGRAATGGGKDAVLERMFRPPWELMFKGKLEAAFRFADGQNKWLLVNVQDEREFVCQTLNRDTWSHDGVKRLVGDNFVFCQPLVEDEDGRWYAQFYPVQLFPHIAVMNPATKQRVLLLEGPLEAKDLILRLTKFLSEAPTPASVAAAEHSPALSREPSDGSGKKKRRSETDHDEDLARAIAESLSGVDSNAFDEDMGEDLVEDPGSPKRARTEPVVPSPELPKLQSSLPPNVQLRIRKQDGSSFVTGVNQEDSVAYLRQVVASQVGTDPRKVTLTITFPRLELTSQDPASTLSSHGITGSVTLVLGIEQ